MSERRILVRPPSPNLESGEVSHIERSPVDADLAARQWQSYVDAFRAAGWDVIELPPLPQHPDGVFIEDNVFVFQNLAIIMRPGALSRRDETTGLADRFVDLGFDTAAIETPGTIDGGDLLKVGNTVYAGRSARSNADGIAQLRAFLEPLGARVVEVPVTAALHLKSCLTALPDGTIVGYEPMVDEPDSFERLILVEEESGAHVVDLGDDRILLASSCPTAAQHYDALGYHVTTVDISEFEKLEGCVTCLSVRLHDGVD